MAAEPPKKNSGDDEHLELAEGWDQAQTPEAKGEKTSSAGLGSSNDLEDWDTPLEDVSWDDESTPGDQAAAVNEGPERVAVSRPEAAEAEAQGEVISKEEEDEHPVHLLELAWEDDDEASPEEIKVSPAPEPASDPVEEVPKPFDSHLADADDDFEGPATSASAPPPSAASSDFDELEGPEPEAVPAPVSETPPVEPASAEEGPSEAGAEPADDLSAEQLALIAEHTPAEGKVELDIEGMSLDSPLGAEEPPAEEAAASAPPADKAAAEPVPLPPEEAPVRKIPKLKLLLILGPAVLVLFALVFGVYKLFLSKPAPVEVPLEVQVDHWPAAKNEGPGDKELESFLLILPGPADDYLIKADVTIFYTDFHWFLDISDREVVYRDIIYRLLQSQSPDILNDIEAQHQLGEDIKNALNQRLGGPGLEFVILEFRALN